MPEAVGCIDLEKLYERFDNDPELIAQVRDVFVQETPARLGKIRRALETGDIEGMVKLAHSLKGVCATMYAQPLREKSLAVEMAARQGDVDAVRRSVPEMMGMLEELSAFLASLP
jgi:histidine phosphotransfer protein HptB